MNSKPIWALVEKTLATYVQALIVALLGSKFFESVDLSLARSLALASIPAALTVLVNATSAAAIPPKIPPLLQAVLRTLRTGGVSFLGYLIAMPIFSLDRSVLSAAIAATGTAVLAAIKAELGTLVGNPQSVALLPASLDPAPTDGPLPPLHT